MNDLSALQSLGLELPSPAYIVGSIIFGVIGIIAFRRGRKLGRKRTWWLGIALMLYPYAVTQTWLLYVVGVVLSAGVAIDRD